MVTHHGLWAVPLALVGLWLGWERRSPMAIMAAGWLFLILDFSTTGGIAALAPFLTRYLNPRDLAWYGPVIPYAILGGMALVWLWETVISPRIPWRITYRTTYAINGGLAAVLLVLIVFSGPVRELATSITDQSDAYATTDDIDALDWVRQETRPDVRVLNFADPYEGGWVPVIAERPSATYPLLPYARYPVGETDVLRDFWEDPADPTHAETLREAGIDLVVVPAVIADPDRADDAWRWEDPIAREIEMRSRVADAPYLSLVHTAGSARIYQLEGTQIFDQDDDEDES
jgi:hypothetical protein